MSRGKLEYLRARRQLALESLMEVETRILDELQTQEKFQWVYDYPNGDSIKWIQPYRGRNYTWIALKINDYWYTTSIKQHERMSSDELISQYLSKANKIWMEKSSKSWIRVKNG